VPNGVDDLRFTPGTAPLLRLAWGLDAGTVAVVIARRLVPKNGVLDAARALAHTRAKLRFVFVGDGPERATMVAEIASRGVTARALFTGALPNDQMPEVYRAADICVLPSRMEATSIAGLEAMATGRALVGTRVGGIPALIDDGRTGLLVPAGDPAALAGAIDSLAQDAERRALFGAAARLRVEREFAWPRIAERTRVAYREALEKPA
jgi:glycosyltransferase involved in cell wall biosynthesis